MRYLRLVGVGITLIGLVGVVAGLRSAVGLSLDVLWPLLTQVGYGLGVVGMVSLAVLRNGKLQLLVLVVVGLISGGLVIVSPT